MDEQPKLDPTEALRKFEKELEKVLDTHRSKLSERDRYIFLLMAAANLLKDFQSYPKVGKAFFELSSMLVDLEAGKIHPVLKADPVPGPPDSTVDWDNRAKISLGVVAVMATGKNQTDAAKYVARQLGLAIDRVRRSDRRSGQPWKAVYNWYVSFSAKKVENDIAQDGFDLDVAKTRHLVATKPEAERRTAVDAALRRLKKDILSN